MEKSRFIVLQKRRPFLPFTVFQLMAVCLLIITIMAPANAQQQELPQFYKDREALAPPHIKQEIIRLRNEIKAKNYSFLVGYTAVAEKRLKDLTGLKAYTPEYLQTAKNSALESEKKMLPLLGSGTCSATNRTHDARRLGYVSPVRDQNPCGSCWAFGTMAMYETSHLKTNGGVSTSIDASEQQIIDCVNGDCFGGWPEDVFIWMVDRNNKVKREREYPYEGDDDSRCPAGEGFYEAVAWGIVEPSKNLLKIPTVSQIKGAICAYGAVQANFQTDEVFRYYAGEVYGTFRSATGNIYDGVNHSVLIIGWDDSKNAWLAKNSWGTDWGSTCGYGTERGYFWIGYDQNNIGHGAKWVRAKEIISTWGHGGDYPIAGDFNRDGKGDRGIFRPSDRTWYFDFDFDNRTDDRTSPWAFEGDLPLAGDFDSDGFRDDIAAFRPSERTWYYDFDHNGTTDLKIGPWGNKGDLPVAGDFDNDGKYDDVAVFRPSDRTWYFDYNHNGDTDNRSGPWANAGDLPFAGDLDHDGKHDDVGIYRPSDKIKYVDLNHNSSTDGTGSASDCIGKCLPVVLTHSYGDNIWIFCRGNWWPKDPDSKY